MPGSLILPPLDDTMNSRCEVRTVPLTHLEDPGNAMNEYIASTYGDHLAEVYDEWFSSYEDAAIDTIYERQG